MATQPVALDDVGATCPQCDYDLRGLSEPVCAECGYEFNVDRLRRRRPRRKWLGIVGTSISTVISARILYVSFRSTIDAMAGDYWVIDYDVISKAYLEHRERLVYSIPILFIPLIIAFTMAWWARFAFSFVRISTIVSIVCWAMCVVLLSFVLDL